jgi:hypothetical protein
MSNRGVRGLRAAVLAGVVIAVTAAGPVSAKGPSAGSWTAATAVSGLEQPDPTRGSQGNDVAVNANGVALAVWDRFNYNAGGAYTIGAAVETGGRWAAPIVVSPETTGYASGPRAAVAPNGTLAVSWTWTDLSSERIEVAVRPAGGTVWTTTVLSRATVGGTQGLGLTAPLAFDGASNLTAAWTEWDGTGHRLGVATLPAGATAWSATSPDLTVDALYPHLAVNAAGAAVIGYVDSPYTATGATAMHVTTRAGSGAGWSTPVVVSEQLTNTIGYVSAPMVGIDGAGLVTAAWFARGVESSRQTGPTSWTPRRTILDPGTFGESIVSVDLATDATGKSVAVADVFDATVGVDRASVWVARGAADGTWSPQLRLTDPTVPVDAYAARAAVSPDGGLALVAWVDHYHGTVGSARWVPSTGTWSMLPVGRGTAFSSFQETLSLSAATSSSARVAWKNARGGTQTMVADFRP